MNTDANPPASAPAPAPPLSRVAMYILLAIGPEERHGYAIMHEVRRITDGAVQLGPGAIYTTIKRLLGDGLIEESEERPDPELDDQRRRYYRLTALGRSVAATEVRRLDALVASARPWALAVALATLTRGAVPAPFAVPPADSRRG